jgi:hypothetical protein
MAGRLVEQHRHASAVERFDVQYGAVGGQSAERVEDDGVDARKNHVGHFPTQSIAGS